MSLVIEPKPFTLLRPNPFFHRKHRLWRRKRLKPSRIQTTSQLPFETLFENFVSTFPSFSSLNIIAPAIGLASGAALYLSKVVSKKGYLKPMFDLGEWVLFTSPTPFNRFVVFRCPSISLKDNDQSEDFNEKLVKEEIHFVRLDSGRIQVRNEDEVADEKLVYQRVCVTTDDGGVISLDWPANLDLSEEHGLDTTILLVPGSAKGSMDKYVRSFVCDSLKRGCFPVVMNPRGCAGSPLTTPRLFTAADSDDISTAVQFISRARPWTTIMSVGWGYGANMLTKYLAEVGEGTPLTAATCIDNPFDLEEATRSSPHHFVLDRKLTGGLVDILQSNKELFLGRAKGFDVEKALLANSVRDFEKSISMVSYGYDAIEDFYENSSTRLAVGEVKIPVLFIQNDDGGAPLFSIPRNLIAENPFTSLLLCSCSSGVPASRMPAINWCHHLTIEWLAAVELGLLKGRHPLLKDVDIALNPSEGLSTLTSRASERQSREQEVLELSQTDYSNGYKAFPENMVREGAQNSQKDPELGDEGLQQESNGSLEEKKPVGAELVGDEAMPEDEKGQVLQAAQVVMNMLDVTMPGTLSDVQKKKVLTAVGKGETVMKALQDVVPEDVSEKIKTAVSGFLSKDGGNLKLEKLMNISRLPKLTLGQKSKVQENVGSGDGEHGNSQSPDPNDSVDSGSEVSADNKSKVEPEVQASNSEKTANDENSSASSSKPDSSDQLKKDPNDGPAKVDLKEENKTDDDKTEPPTKKDQESNAVPSADAQTVEKEDIEEKVSQSVSTEGGTDVPELNVSEGLEDLTGIDDSTQMAMNSVFGVIENAITMVEEGKDDETKGGSENGAMENMVTEFEEGKGDETKGDDKNNQVTVKNKVMGKEEVKNKESLHSETKEDKDRRTILKDKQRQISNPKPLNGSITEFEKGKGDETKGDDKNNQVIVKNKVMGKEKVENKESSHSKTKEDKHGRIILKDNEKHISSPKPLNGSMVDNSANPTIKDHIGGEENEKRMPLLQTTALSQRSSNIGQYYDPPLYINSKPYSSIAYQEYIRKYLLMRMESTKSSDLNPTTDLSLDYIPEEGKWTLLDHPDVTLQCSRNSPIEGGIDKRIKSPYDVMNSKEKHEPFLDHKTLDMMNGKIIHIDTSEELMRLVKKIILDALKIEIGRRSSASTLEDMEKLTTDAEKVAIAVSVAAGCSKNHKLCSDGKILDPEGTLDGKEIVNAISLSIQETNYLKKVLPLGVVVGSSLASLRKYFNVATVNGVDQSKTMTSDHMDLPLTKKDGLPAKVENDKEHHGELDHETDNSMSEVGENDKKKSISLNNGTIMAGAFTAALGASALLGNKEDSVKDNKAQEDSTNSLVEKGNSQDSEKLNEENSPKKLVSSLAEKAMSVAGPVVPKNEDGEIDQERLVAMLTELGQRGGMLKMLAKFALLWGGMRGAMSLTDKLIKFLKIAERPLYQRVLAFMFMVILLWSPVVVPMMPSLVQSWGSMDTPKFTLLICIGGFYASIMILVTLWGKKVRGYDNPFEQYGLDLTSSPKIKNYLMGLMGGVLLVLSIHSVNALLGCVRLSWSSVFTPKSVDSVSRLKMVWKFLLLVGHGTITATAISFAEELLFRSWLPDEIAADFGYHSGVIFSGLAFALFQRSLLAIPGLWLMSLSLSGARQRSQGSLYVPIGLRAGILATSSVLKNGGFLAYKRNFPIWVAGSHPFQPFCDAVGIAFALVLAICLYPRNPLHQDVKKREIRD